MARRLLVGMGENLKMARLRRNLPIRVIAERAGVSVNTIAALEKGGGGVSIGVLANVLHALGLSEDMKLIAGDDSFGRKLQDLGLLPQQRASRKKRVEKADEQR